MPTFQGMSDQDKLSDIEILNRALFFENRGVWAYRFAADKPSNSEVGRAVLALAAVTAADVRHNNAYFVQRQMKNGGEMLAQCERLLSAGPQRDVVSFDVRDGGMRLHGKVLHSRKSKGVFKNVIRFLKTFLDVALGVAKAVAKIAAGKFFRRFVMLCHHLSAAGGAVVH